MNYIGISCGFHDASLSVIDNHGEILFAAHSERYSKIKNDASLNRNLIIDALNYVTGNCEIHYYEKPLIKWFRQIYSGEYSAIKQLNVKNLIGTENLQILKNPIIKTHKHHLSHAAAGFQTSPFSHATVVIIDSVGEWDTISIWGASYVSNKATYKKLWSITYPNSIGLFYSALTKHANLKPQEEEYILMGMSAFGQPVHADLIEHTLLNDTTKIKFSQNLHIGLEPEFLKKANKFDIASSAQHILEKMVYIIMAKAKKFNWSDNLVYMGGVALNCVANRNLGNYFSNIWVFPNPGDAGSSLGAAALGYKKKIYFKTAFLGYDIKSSVYPVQDILEQLNTTKVAAVAHGRAEFGPRALGNRSLLADPRDINIKEKVNQIKKRQPYRPFAAVILEEHMHEYFDVPAGWINSRYMQIVAKCRYPELYPGIVHVDNTTRIQTVPDDDSGIRKLLQAWYNITGCPLLLNTSLNIRGLPMINDENDIINFQNTYKIKVCV